MAVGEAEAWGIFANVVAGPMSTIVAALISASGLTLSAAMLNDAVDKLVKQQLVTQTAIIQRIPRPQFF